VPETLLWVPYADHFTGDKRTECATLVNLFALVLLAGLSAASLLICLATGGVHRPEWLIKRCDFCAGYWLSVGLLLVAALASWLLGGLPWWLPLAALPLGVPAAAVCRVVVGQL
jgi:hypothetical protein